MPARLDTRTEVRIYNADTAEEMADLKKQLNEEGWYMRDFAVMQPQVQGYGHYWATFSFDYPPTDPKGMN